MIVDIFEWFFTLFKFYVYLKSQLLKNESQSWFNMEAFLAIESFSGKKINAREENREKRRNDVMCFGLHSACKGVKPWRVT